MKKLLQIQKLCVWEATHTHTHTHTKFELALNHRVRFRVFIFAFFMMFILNNASSQCMWEHYSEIDCAYELEIGYVCDNQPTYDHAHTFGTGMNTGVLCTGGPPPPLWSSHTGCGCWGNPGGTYRAAGCGFCGAFRTDLCSLANLNGHEEFRYLIVIFPPSSITRVYQWDQYDDYEMINNYWPNRTVCCPDGDPDLCYTCSCATADVDWENSISYLRPAHDPYFPPCPDPNQ